MYFMLIVIEKIPKFKESSGLDFNGNSLKAPPQYFYDSLRFFTNFESQERESNSHPRFGRP